MPRMLRNPRITLGLLLLFVLSTTSCTMWGEKKTATWKSVTSGEQMERLFWEEVKQKHWSVVKERMAATVIGMNAEGNFSREEMIEHLKQWEIVDFQVGEVRTEPAGSDLVVSYILTLHGTNAGSPLPDAVRVMSVWQQVKSGYILVARSVIPVQR
jgi:hypothetical protein